MATEEPAFSVVVQERELEVRDFSTLIGAEVAVTGSRGEAANPIWASVYALRGPISRGARLSVLAVISSPRVRG